MIQKTQYLPQIGEKSYNLTVVDNNERYLNFPSGRKRAILCRCICGNEKLIPLNKLTSHKIKNRVKSCGCNSFYPGQPKNGRKKNSDTPFMELYRAYKAAAKKRNLLFEINLEKFKELIAGNCHYCGKDSDFRKRNGIEFYANGIDRVDSSIGYVIENCVSSCKICNNMKWEISKDIFLKHIEKIVNYNNLLCKEI